MPVIEKFNEFKSEMKAVFDSDTDKLLEMSSMSVDQLVSSHYLHRKIDSFMYINDFSLNEINRYFAEECSDIDVATLDPIEEGYPEEKICDLIFRVKIHTVKCKLWFQLVDFMSRMKEENINRN